MAGVAFVDTAAGNRLDNEFLHQINELRYIRQPKIIAQTNNPGFCNGP
jgi:riboflavin biosynthesis pyrimidine reductase